MLRRFTLVLLSALLLSPAFAAAPSLDPPLPPGSSDDIAARMMMRHEAALAATRAAAQPASKPVIAPSPADPAPATQPDPAKWAALLTQLADPDFATREAAQRELNKLDWRQLPFLRSAAETAADLEIKGRLTARVAALEEDLATNPPPVSVSLKNATITDVCDELAKNLGIKLDPYPSRNSPANPSFTFTLDATDRPFWEVFFNLARQHPLGFYDNGNQMMLSTNAGQIYYTGSFSGPLAIVPTSINRQRNVSFQTPNGPTTSAETMSLNCTLLLDPRIRPITLAGPNFTEVVDDLGNVLLSQPAPNNPLTPNSGSLSYRGIFQTSTGVSLKMPEKRGAKITSARGVLRLLVQASDERLDITDLEKKVGQTFDFAGTTLRLRSFNLDSSTPNGPVNVSVYLISDNAAARLPVGGGGNPPTFNISLIDATGKTVYTVTSRGSSSINTSGNLALPLTVRLSAPAKTKELTLPFELKDLPLP